jgi:hypothetical protein
MSFAALRDNRAAGVQSFLPPRLELAFVLDGACWWLEQRQGHFLTRRQTRGVGNLFVVLAWNSASAGFRIRLNRPVSGLL